MSYEECLYGRDVWADLPVAAGGKVAVKGVITGRTKREVHVEFERANGPRFLMTMPPKELRFTERP